MKYKEIIFSVDHWWIGKLMNVHNNRVLLPQKIVEHNAHPYIQYATMKRFCQTTPHHASDSKLHKTCMNDQSLVCLHRYFKHTKTYFDSKPCHNSTIAHKKAHKHTEIILHTSNTYVYDTTRPNTTHCACVGMHNPPYRHTYSRKESKYPI